MKGLKVLIRTPRWGNDGSSDIIPDIYSITRREKRTELEKIVVK